jgi:hypothetical protein
MGATNQTLSLTKRAGICTPPAPTFTNPFMDAVNQLRNRCIDGGMRSCEDVQTDEILIPGNGNFLQAKIVSGNNLGSIARKEAIFKDLMDQLIVIDQKNTSVKRHDGNENFPSTCTWCISKYSTTAPQVYHSTIYDYSTGAETSPLMDFKVKFKVIPRQNDDPSPIFKFLKGVACDALSWLGKAAITAITKGPAGGEIASTAISFACNEALNLED